MNAKTADLEAAGARRSSTASRSPTPTVRRSRRSATSTRTRSTKRQQATELRVAKNRKPPLGPAGGHPGGRRRLDRRRPACRRARGSIALQDTMPGERLDDRRQAQGGRRDRPRRHEHDRARRARSTRTCRRATRRSAARCCCRPTPTRTIGGSSAGSADGGVGRLLAARDRHGDLDRSAQLIAPAGNAGVVGLKPTVGLVSRSGHAAGRQVAGLARADRPDGRRRGDARWTCSRGPTRATRPRWAAEPAAQLHGGPLARRRSRARRSPWSSSTTAPYPAAVTELETLGATTDDGDARQRQRQRRASIPYEFHRDLDSFLGGFARAKARNRCRKSSNTTTPTRSRA